MKIIYKFLKLFVSIIIFFIFVHADSDLGFEAYKKLFFKKLDNNDVYDFKKKYDKKVKSMKIYKFKKIDDIKLLDTFNFNYSCIDPMHELDSDVSNVNLINSPKAIYKFGLLKIQNSILYEKFERGFYDLPLTELKNKNKYFVSYGYFPDKSLIKVFKFENDPSIYEAKPYESEEKIYLFEEDYFISKKNNKIIKKFIKKIKKNNEIVNYLNDLEDLRKFTETSIENININSKKYLTCKPIFIY